MSFFSFWLLPPENKSYMWPFRSKCQIDSRIDWVVSDHLRCQALTMMLSLKPRQPHRVLGVLGVLCPFRSLPHPVLRSGVQPLWSGSTRCAGRSLAFKQRLEKSLPWLPPARCGLTVAGHLCQGPQLLSGNFSVW